MEKVSWKQNKNANNGCTKLLYLYSFYLKTFMRWAFACVMKTRVRALTSLQIGVLGFELQLYYLQISSNIEPEREHGDSND